MKSLYLFILLIFGLIVKAQNDVPPLVTDRPDQTESAVLVPHKYLQIETGFVMENNETDMIKHRAFAYNTTLLRYGLLKNFELRLGIDYLGLKENYNNPDSITNISGFSPLFTGFKIKIIEEDGWIPEIALLGGLALPFTASEDFKTDYTAGNIRFAFSYTLSDRFSLGYNLGVLWNGQTAIPDYFYSISLGVGITDKIGMFVESYGFIPKAGKATNLLDAGFTFLLLPNFQLDASGGIGLENNIGYFISAGLTYRLPH